MLDARTLAEMVRQKDGDFEASESTVHYYTQLGVLPPAVGRGRNGFTPEHLARFRVARKLRRAGFSLAEIRTRLSALGRKELEAEVAAMSQPTLPAAQERAQPFTPAPIKVRRGRQQPDTIVTEALEARPSGLSRNLRFRGGFTLQCPQGVPDELIARLYNAIESVLEEVR